MKELDAGVIVPPRRSGLCRVARAARPLPGLMGAGVHRAVRAAARISRRAAAFTYQFLHGDAMHLLGNLAILLLAGPFAEAALGRALPAGLPGSGAIAGAVHLLISDHGLIGASGAISGTMAMVAVLYGTRKVPVFYWLFVYFNTARVPAVLLLPVWLADRGGAVGASAATPRCVRRPHRRLHLRGHDRVAAEACRQRQGRPHPRRAVRAGAGGTQVHPAARGEAGRGQARHPPRGSRVLRAVAGGSHQHAARDGVLQHGAAGPRQGHAARRRTAGAVDTRPQCAHRTAAGLHADEPAARVEGLCRSTSSCAWHAGSSRRAKMQPRCACSTACWATTPRRTSTAVSWPIVCWDSSRRTRGTDCDAQADHIKQRLSAHFPSPGRWAGLCRAASRR